MASLVVSLLNLILFVVCTLCFIQAIKYSNRSWQVMLGVGVAMNLLFCVLNGICFLKG